MRTGDHHHHLIPSSAHSHLDSAAQCIDDLDQVWRYLSCTRCCLFSCSGVALLLLCTGGSLTFYLSSILDSYARSFAHTTSVCFGSPGSSGSGAPPLTPGDAQDFQLHWPGQTWLGENDALHGLRHEQATASTSGYQHCPARRETIRSRHIDES